MIQLGGPSSNRLNPLDPGPRASGLPEEQWLGEISRRRRALLGSLAEAALGRPLVAVEHTALDAALDTAVRRAGSSTPVLPDVVSVLLGPVDALPGATLADLTRDGRDLGHALRRLVAGDLAGLFDGASTIRFDPSLPMVSLDLSAIHGSDQLLAMVMTFVSAWMEAALADPTPTADNGGSSTTKPGDSCDSPRSWRGCRPSGSSRAATASPTS